MTMPYRIVQTTDGQHVGTVLSHVEKGQIITFEDGDVVPVDDVYTKDDGTILAVGPNYQMKLVQE